MLVGVLTDNTLEAARVRANHYYHQVDLFELRIDCLLDWDISALSAFQLSINKPLLLTLRAASGCDEAIYLAQLDALATLQPAYLDVAYPLVSNDWIAAAHVRYPSIQWVRSYHDYLTTPDSLIALWSSLIHPTLAPSCYIIKLITTAQSSLDSLRLLQLIQQVNGRILDENRHYQSIIHGMGELGVPTRVLGAALGNVFTYAALPMQGDAWIDSREKIPGLLDINTLQNVYHIQHLTHQTAFFALLGDPISQSVGHLFHNAEFEQHRIVDHSLDGVYVKFKVSEAELPMFLSMTSSLPFKGFSITTPLKRVVVRFVDRFMKCDQTIIPPLTAINTLRADGGELWGCNTDGIGAVRAIERSLNTSFDGYGVILLGAGGAAEGIADAMLRLGMRVLVVNRTLSNAQKLVQKMHDVMISPCIEAYDFSMFDEISLDASAMGIAPILIYALSPHVELPMSHLSLWMSAQKGSVLDINYYHPHLKLRALAEEKGWTIVDGIEMFNHQARAQLDFWKG